MIKNNIEKIYEFYTLNCSIPATALCDWCVLLEGILLQIMQGIFFLNRVFEIGVISVPIWLIAFSFNIAFFHNIFGLYFWDFLHNYFKEYLYETFPISILALITQVIFVLLSIALFTLLERKVLSSVQRRVGPNTVSSFGFLQPFADGLKLFTKELILPSNINLPIFILAPSFTLFFTLLVWSLLPVSKFFMVLEAPFGLLFILAISSLSVHTLLFAGWASNSKYAFLGGIRSASQMISYEICMGTIFASIVLMSGSYSLADILKSQEHVSFILPLFPLWLVFIVCSLAETNRAPFDLPEAEAELVAGYNVEYSAIAFAMFFLAEYGNILIMSCLSTIFFFGGNSFIESFFSFFYNNNDVIILKELFYFDYLYLFFFSIKVSFNLFIFLWVRSALPRYRYDQLMKLGWKVLIPVCFSFIMLQSAIMITFNIFPFI